MSEKLAQHLNSQLIDYTTGWLSSMHKGLHCPMHKHTTIEIVYHAIGYGTSQIDQIQPIEYKQGSLTIYPSNIWHDQLSITEGEDYCVHIKSKQPASDCVTNVIHIPFLADTYSQREMRELALLSTPQTDIDWICANHRTHALLARLLQIASSKTQQSDHISNAQKYAAQAYEYIAHHFQKIKCLEEVANHLGVSQDYLRHMFQKHYDIRMTDHLTTCRIEHAKGLLTHSTLSAKAVAFQCGYTTARHFSSTFQKHVGMSPISFRKESTSY